MKQRNTEAEMEHYEIMYSDTGEYSVPMTLEEAKSCIKLFAVDQYIVDIRTGEVVMEG
jgi:hypothetical protein